MLIKLHFYRFSIWRHVNHTLPIRFVIEKVTLHPALVGVHQHAGPLHAPAREPALVVGAVREQQPPLAHRPAELGHALEVRAVEVEELAGAVGHPGLE
eukprot:CAMPEP_0194712766 /NCGR_PEP_ID=MMETSP0296-20130528/4779_1 /TAXON_ID=39354 /ORGANISM="Heterosigma akashiwo, Strain CCMP2393" /LENGTH=97 /DNA_ID=CAMNT_0039611283 /DNA_START=140 /DNA_END=430 /DNA_ORIENTATION=+